VSSGRAEPLATPGSPLADTLLRLQGLTGARQEWLSSCRASWRGGGVLLEALVDPTGEERRAFAVSGRDWPTSSRELCDELGVDPHPDLSAALAILALARALVDPAAATDHVERSARHWLAAWAGSAGLAGGDRRIEDLEPKVAETIALIRHVAPPQCRGVMELLTRALAGGLPAAGARRTATLPVLLDFGHVGRNAHLNLTLTDSGPPGLHLDPRLMGFLITDQRFALSASKAWAQSRLAADEACVLWSLTSRDQPCNSIEDGSLGGAFVVALDELHERSRRRGALRLRRLNRGCAVTASLTGSDRLSAVAGLENKLRAAQRNGVRVIAGAANQSEREEVTKTARAIDGVEVECVANVAQALRAARRQIERPVRYAAAALVAGLIAAGAIAVPLILESNAQAEAAEQRGIATAVASESVSLGHSNPRLAALLALASQKIAPGPSADEALIGVAQTDEFVSRLIPASGGQLNTVVASGERLFSAGEDGKLSVWNTNLQRVGVVPTGRVIETLAADERAPVIASTAENAPILLWDVHDPRHPAAWVLPSSARNNGAYLQFNQEGTRLFALAADGSVTAWDVPSRRYLFSYNLASLGVPLLRPNGRTLKIVAANTDPSIPSGATAHDTRVLLATNGREVLSVDLDRREASELLSGSAIPGEVSSLAGERNGDEFLAVGTTAGVLLWDRSTFQRTAFPFGGISEPVNDVAWTSDGELAISTGQGVALAENLVGAAATTTSHGNSAAPDSRPQGGATGALAIWQGKIIGAQEDGNMAVFDPERSHLTLPQAAGSDVLAFDPRGDLLLADAAGDSSHLSDLYLIHPSVTVGHGATGESEDGEPYPRIRTFSPPNSWWPSNNTFYANDAVLAGGLVVAGGQDPFNTASVMAWNANTGKPLAYIRIPGGEPHLVTQVAVIPDKHLMLADSLSGQLGVWSTRTWNLLGNVYVGPNGGFSVNASGSAALVTGFSSAHETEKPVQDTHGDFIVIDLRTLKAVRRVAHGAVVHAVYSPDGQSIATVSADRKLRFYSPQTLRPLSEAIPLGGDYPIDVAWRGDSRRVAVTTFEGRTFVIDVRGRDFAVPPLVDPNGDQSIAVAWDPVASILAVTSRIEANSDSYNGKTNFWDLDRASWDVAMCDVAGSNLTTGEWQSYIGHGEPFRRLCPGTP
jgi:WD40 repeat protein